MGRATAWDYPQVHTTLRCGPRAAVKMDKTNFLDDLQQRISQLLAGTPAADVQKNLKALLTQQFARLDLVTREEFDTQAQVLARTREKLKGLEERLAALESARK
jgi:BMFP domain-containing protein YqiC